MTGLTIADRWFERRTLSDAITHLWEPHVDPFARCNIWHVRGRDRDLLVDSGMGMVSLRHEIRDLIDKPLDAVATHSHFDHVGSLHEFDERVMHPSEAPEMESDPPFAMPLGLADLPPGFTEMLEQSGYTMEGEYLISALPHAGYDPATFRIAPTNITRTVDDGDIVDLGDRHFEVMHLPGHSPGSIGLWESASETLFSGDAIYDGALLDMLPESNVAAYIETMKRLRELPVRVVHAGHETSFGRVRLIELADAYLAARDR